MTSDPDLDAAYGLSSTEDTLRLYAAWADTYDRDFSDAHGFMTPGLVARMYADTGAGGPVLDVGAGTGLVGALLSQLGVAPVDGIDLSPEMLQMAEAKGCYRHLTVADVTRPLDLKDRYAGVVSSGTFTLGHVGPEGLLHVLAVAQPSAPVLIGMNRRHFEDADFARALEDLGARDLSLTEHRIYAHHQDPAHRDDIGVVLKFSAP